MYANEGALFDSRDPGIDNVAVDRGPDWAFSIEPLVADGGGEAVGTSRYLRIDGLALLAGVSFLVCGILLRKREKLSHSVVWHDIYRAHCVDAPEPCNRRIVAANFYSV